VPPFIAKKAEKVVDYLLTLRPIYELTLSMKIRVDQVDMEISDGFFLILNSTEAKILRL
jgi:hypothetical protein